MLDDTEQRRDRRHAKPSDASQPDLVIGAAEIARLTGQKVSSVYYWAAKQMYGDAVWKAGRKTLCGSRERLRALGKANP